MIRVAIDTNALYVSRAGVARYIRGLLQGFKQVAAPDAEIRPLAWEEESLDYRQPRRAVKTIYRELVWARFVAPGLIRKNGIQLLHSSFEPLIQPPLGTREIVTLHDLAILRDPERFRRWHRFASGRRLLKVKRADRVICISRFTADEAMAVLGLPARKMAVVHNGCDFQPGEPPPESPPEAKVPPEFFLFVGSLEPGKNLALLKEVYRLAEAARRHLPPLLIVGARWEGVAHEGPPPQQWHYLGRQPDAALIYLYRRAIALVFPSKYEGFGFPVVEAMALGCPVICSPVASLPEVGGNAAVMTDMSPCAYLEVMERLSREKNWREDLTARGLVQASKFSWKKCAAEVLEIYRSTKVAG